jgi:hypothetical protein
MKTIISNKTKFDFEIEIENENRYDEFLDEFCPVVEIGALTYLASQVLKAVDPIAYRIGLQEFLDFENENE